MELERIFFFLEEEKNMLLATEFQHKNLKKNIFYEQHSSIPSTTQWDYSIKNIFQFYLFYFMCMGVLPTCMTVHYLCGPGSYWDLKKVSDPPEREPQMVVICRVGTGNKPRFSGWAAITPDCWALSPAVTIPKLVWKPSVALTEVLFLQ